MTTKADRERVARFFCGSPPPNTWRPWIEHGGGNDDQPLDRLAAEFAAVRAGDEVLAVFRRFIDAVDKSPGNLAVVFYNHEKELRAVLAKGCAP